MFIDASALVAILASEPGADEIVKQMEASPGPFHVSPLVRYEAVSALARKKAQGRASAELMRLARAAVDAFIEDVGAIEMPITTEIGDAAIAAAMQYGKVTGHPADLNFGDCFAYACAKAQGARLLYRGNDFSQTDLR
jgi:ribonuclease VapC